MVEVAKLFLKMCWSHGVIDSCSKEIMTWKTLRPRNTIQERNNFKGFRYKFLCQASLDQVNIWIIPLRFCRLPLHRNQVDMNTNKLIYTLKMNLCLVKKEKCPHKQTLWTQAEISDEEFLAEECWWVNQLSQRFVCKKMYLMKAKM